MKISGLHTLWLPALLVWSGCPGGDTDASAGPQVVREDSAGVPIVRYSGRDRALDWHTEQLWRIGGAGDQEVVLSRLEPEDIDTDFRGQIFLLDALSNQVVVLDAEGRIARRFARSGSGPGELNRPIALDVAPAGEIAVVDRSDATVNHWTSADTFAGKDRLAGFFWGSGFRVTATGEYVYSVLDRAASGTRRRVVLVQQHRDGSLTELTTHTSLPEISPNYPSCPRFGATALPFFAPDLIWDAADDNVAVVTTAEYSIEKFQLQQGTTSIIRRDIAPSELNERRALEELRTLERFENGSLRIRALSCVIPPSELLRARGHAQVFGACQRG